MYVCIYICMYVHKYDGHAHIFLTYIHMYIYKHIYIYINPVCEETLGLLHVTKTHQMFCLSTALDQGFSAAMYSCAR